NPDHFELSPRPSARFLVIKSFTEDDVHRSIRHGIWASTDKGNQRLDRVFKECQEAAKAETDSGTSEVAAGDVPPGHVYLFFSVNGSGQFCGMALMTSSVDFETSSSVWAQEGKWKGHFKVKHIFVKDIPNRELRHIKLENSVENKSVTQSRDTQELGRSQGEEMLRIFYGYPSRTSLLHDMDFY
ncbi:YTH-domain-containing protein, partial [Microstroma glucosiphilum]